MKPQFHRKRDGWLMLRANGSCRFLSRWEGFLYGWFRRIPTDAYQPPIPGVSVKDATP